ncbi:MAG: glycerol-3-phosphate dehydrogenase, partial [Verrucomicrobiaceae bacterium]
MSESPITSVAILGSGSFGMAVAKLLAPKLEHIVLIGRDPETAEVINSTRRNPHYLSGVELEANVRASTRLEDALDFP